MGASSSQMYYHSDAKAAEINNIALTTNIVLIPYSIITNNSTYHKQEPRYCRGCGAALNLHSILHSNDSYAQKVSGEPMNDVELAEEENKKNEPGFWKGRYLRDLKPDEVVWICEFCEVHNRLPADTKLPSQERELYLVKKADSAEPHEEAKEGSVSAVSEDKTSLIFCIDVSGSMGCTHEVAKNGKIEYVPRMQLIQNALLEQLKEMKETHPHRKVGVVLFGSLVTLEGDGSMAKPIVLTNIREFDKIYAEAQTKGKNIITKKLGDNFATLEKVIRQLEIGGSTALGPGLLSALALAAEGETGSRIILCTDGLSNVGAGSLENQSDVAKSREFYDKVADLAVEKGVSVSIITVKGQACKVDALGPLTDRTAGQILRVDPTNFSLADLAANNLIATDVKLKAIIHEGLSFVGEDGINLKNNNSILVKNIGSVSVSNEAYFKYSVKNIEELKKAELSLEELESLPLQAQISYTDLKGNEFIFVASQSQKLTKDHKEAEKGLKADILAGYVQKESANLVLGGKVEEARQQNQAWAQQMEKMANNADLNVENQQALVLFKEQNQQMQALMDNQNVGSAAQQDDVTSKLYEIKQQKQSKYK